MRIITGAAKGRRIVAPDTTKTRPATDRVREAVFSAIGTWVENADVLDLYAGSGSYGFEALSRGADSAMFVEKGRAAIAALRANAETVGLGGTIIAQDVGEFLKASTLRTFHIVFIDPPWDLETAVLDVQLGFVDALLEPDGEVIVSRRDGDRLPLAPPGWRLATDRRYGDARINRYEKEGTSDDRSSVPG